LVIYMEGCVGCIYGLVDFYRWVGRQVGWGVGRDQAGVNGSMWPGGESGRLVEFGVPLPTEPHKLK
jgi:hypothetical protein